MSGWTPPPLPARRNRTARPVLVGRRTELDRLERLWAAVTDGARQAAFLGGEPGAGKTRLLAEFCALLRARGATVLTGACVARAGPRYQPFAEPVEALLGGPAALDPGTRDRLRTLTVRADDDEEPADHRGADDAVVDAVRTAARSAPVVLALEDVHWSGGAGLQLLGHLVRRTAESAVLVLATHRTTAPERSAALTSLLADLHRLDGVRRLDLAGLAREEIAGYLVAETGLPVHRARAAAGLLRDQTGGNPLLLREAVRETASRGALPGKGVPAPPAVRDMVAARLDLLPQPGRRVLQLAAVVGDQPDLATVLAVSAEGEEATLAALDTAAAVGLLEAAGAAVRFPAGLVRQALLDLMPATRRVRAHLRVAAVLEAAEDPSGRRTERLAHHYAEGQALGGAERAVVHLTRAAEAASCRQAFGDAAPWSERAAALAGPPRRHPLLLAAARAHLLAGNGPRARALYADVAGSAGPRERLEAAIGFEAASWRAALPGPRAVELLASALRAVPFDPVDALHVRAVASLGRALGCAGATKQAALLGQRSLELARAGHDDGLLAATLEAGFRPGPHPADAPATVARATELARVAARSGDAGALASAAHQRAVAGYLQGAPRALAEAHEDLLRAGETSGQPFVAYLSGCVGYARQFLGGDLAGAERTCTDLLELGAAFGDDGNDGPPAVGLFLVRREAGALDRVRPLLSGEESPEAHWAPGLLALYTELGLDRSAVRLLHWLLDGRLGRYADPERWPCVLVFLVEAALAAGDGGALRTLRPRVAEYAGTNLVAGRLLAVLGSADRYLGAVDSALGDPRAEEELVRALAMDERTGAVVHRAHDLAALLVHARRTGLPPAALAGLAEEARAVAGPLGLRRVQRVLDPVRPPVPRRAPRPAGLTSREAEVLRLLGAGLANREISTRLVISENTVANHVRSILGKTGAGNRTQAAMYAAAQGLLDDGAVP